MNKLIIFAIIAAGFYYYNNWKPSTTSIVNDMSFGKQISHNGQVYHSDWTKTAKLINGYIRRIDRHYDKNIPIITYNLVITSGDFNNQDIVNISYNGGGNYYWSSKTRPKGSIVFYHAVPGSTSSQSKLDALKEGESVKILAKVSTNSEITSDSGAFLKLMHNNHKIILVEDIL